MGNVKKKFTLQWHYLNERRAFKYGRSMQWWCPHLKPFIQTKANNINCHCLNNLSHAHKHQLQCDNHVSGCSQFSLLSAEALYRTLLEGRMIEVQSYEPLHDDSAALKAFLWGSGQDNMRATPFEVPHVPTAISQWCDFNELEHHFYAFSWFFQSLCISVATCWWHSFMIWAQRSLLSENILFEAWQWYCWSIVRSCRGLTLNSCSKV